MSGIKVSFEIHRGAVSNVSARAAPIRPANPANGNYGTANCGAAGTESTQSGNADRQGVASKRRALQFDDCATSSKSEGQRNPPEVVMGLEAYIRSGLASV
jgi:hypothetical protein